jgi:hypothetical protein
MTLLLPFIYFILFIFLIWKMKFFAFEGLSKMQMSGLFILKVAAGAAVWFVYTHYYPSSDFHVYFNSSKIAFNNLFGSSSQLIPGWNPNFDDELFNSSRVLIFINFLIHFFSFNNLFVHIVFFCFLSFVGFTALFKAFWLHFPDRKIVLLAGIYLVPSVLFWTAGIYKETVAIFCMGLMIYMTDFGLRRSYSLSGIIAIILVFILLFFTKMYVAAAIFPVIIVNCIISRTNNKNVLLKYMMMVALLLLIIHLFSKINDRTNMYKLLADKQAKAISEAQGGIFLVNEYNFIRVDVADRDALFRQSDSTYIIKEGINYLSWELDNMQDTTRVSSTPDTSAYSFMYEQQPANSFVEMKRMNGSAWSVYKSVPQAVLNVLIQPTLFAIKNVMQLFSWLENIWLLLIIVMTIFFFDKKYLIKKEVLLFCLAFGCIQIAVIGLVTPSIGGLVRYKVTALPFIVTVALLCINYEKLYRKLKKAKGPDSGKV